LIKLIAFSGFLEDGVFDNMKNETVQWRSYYEDYRAANIKFSKFSYAGPIVMGVGGENKFFTHA